jgi:CIC family chloride channel protein
MKAHNSALRDFTVDRRVWLLCALAVGIGTGAAALAVFLLAAIHFATNVFYYHRFSMLFVRPSGSPLGWLMPFVPVVGGLLVGLMARYGSDKIRGHGIPEAIEAILLRGARINPGIALLKPLSAAISIGSGGPFGAEGPIIMTGGAFGSLVAQWVHLSDAERTTLLVAGAAGGMSATFAAPVAAILLAVELLLFEWRPRSLLPVAVASATASLLRDVWIGHGPMFPMAPMPEHFTWLLCPAALGFGMLTGLISAGLSRLMYGFEDLFGKLPVHWMWWPAIGGIGVGVGGIFFPRGLGVGYNNIAQLLAGHATWALVFGLLIGKSLMWAFSLGSGTSGGVLAPLLMIGGALGTLAATLAHASPEMQALWALLGMAAMLSGSLGIPITAAVFALELTHALPALLPLLLAAVGAHLVTALVLPRSILTEKLGRRGFHLTREYGVDPLEMITVGEAMESIDIGASGPNVDAGFVSWALPEMFAYSDETCRETAERMATAGSVSLPVFDRESRLQVGQLSLQNLLIGRQKAFEREQFRLRAFTEKHNASVVR